MPTHMTPSVFSVDVAGLARHPNPVACVVMGRRAPLAVIADDGRRIEGDVLIIRPGIEHRIDCAGGLTAMYLDGLRWAGRDPLAERLEGQLAALARDGMDLDGDAQQELRERLDGRERDPRLGAVLAMLDTEPMNRMSQLDLAARLGLERTRALRYFKATTGTTFRGYKRWVGLQHAARLIVAGELVRTAALDSGFADTAHLTRTFRNSFGLTPSAAIAGMPTIGR